MAKIEIKVETNLDKVAAAYREAIRMALYNLFWLEYDLFFNTDEWAELGHS